jgi:hypothetical protein
MTWSSLDALEDCFVPYEVGERTVIVNDLLDSEDFDERVGTLIEMLGLDVEGMGLISASEYGVTFRSHADVQAFWVNYSGSSFSFSHKELMTLH